MFCSQCGPHLSRDERPCPASLYQGLINTTVTFHTWSNYSCRATQNLLPQTLHTHFLCGDVGLCIMALLGEDDVEDCVRTAAGLIHVCGRHSPGSGKLLEFICPLLGGQA